jgi:hypothetical protein
MPRCGEGKSLLPAPNGVGSVPVKRGEGGSFAVLSTCMHAARSKRSVGSVPVKRGRHSACNSGVGGAPGMGPCEERGAGAVLSTCMPFRSGWRAWDGAV